MSYERLSQKNTKGGEGLDVFLEGATTMYNRQLLARDSADELKFNTSVLENNLSLEDQLAYRQDQLKRVSDNPDEKRRVTLEVSGLKDRIEQQEFSDEYLEELVGFESGMSSIDSLISWLEEQKSTATDLTIKDNINKELVTRKGQKFTITQNILSNQTTYALKDKTDSVLNAQISRLSSERSKALLSGNEEFMSSLDLQLQSLNKSKLENDITKDMQSFATNTITGYSNAIGLLDNYNSKVSSSDATESITIGGVTYNSTRDFWTFTRDSYLADSSSSGFFNRFNSEKVSELNVKNSKNLIDAGDVKSVSNEFNNLSGRTELANFGVQLDATKQNVIQTGTDLLANIVLNKYSTDSDLNKATTELNSIRTLGGNIEDAFSNLLITGGSVKQGQVNNMLDMGIQIMQDNPGMSYADAVNQALKMGAGATLSPEQLSTKTAGGISTEFAEGFEEESFTEDPRTTAPEAVKTEVPDVVPTVAPAPELTPPISIERQMDFGTSGADVRELQKFLNKAGFQVASSGAGAPGEETEYFGELTQSALQKFQSSQGIVSQGDAATTGYGRLGPQTLKAVKEYKY